MSIVHLGAAIVWILVGAGGVAAELKYLMPRELVETAEKLNCTQVEDFFDRPGSSGPPYVYGYASGRAENSAAFWCERRSSDGERSFRLIVRAQHGRAEAPLTCPQELVWGNYPGGLDVYRVRGESLSEFRYLDSPKTAGPPRSTMLHDGIRSTSGGVTVTFYCHHGRWLFRIRH